MEFLRLFGGLVEKVGATVAGIALMVAGGVWMLPYFGVPAYVAQGFGMFGLGIGVIAFGKRSKKAQDLFVASEAEKRRLNPDLPTSSGIPQIQTEIDIQQSQQYRNTKH